MQQYSPDHNNSYTVILSASIRPHPSLRAFARADIRQRLEDYKNGLKFWLSLPDGRIGQLIFVENTGHDLSELQNLAESTNQFGRNIEFISLDCTDIPKGLHYGYAEFGLIDEGLRTSRLYPHTTAVIKATGRYTFPQLSRLLDRLPSSVKVAVDARRNQFLMPKPYRFVTAALILASREGFETFVRRAYLDMAPPPADWCGFIEDVLYNRLIDHRNDPRIILRWPVNCDPVGFGRKGNTPLMSPRRRALSAARGVLRVVAPRWWV